MAAAAGWRTTLHKVQQRSTALDKRFGTSTTRTKHWLSLACIVCRYGLGTNAMTEGQKSGLIYGSLLFFFILFLSGYLLP